MDYKTDRKVKATLIIEIDYDNVGSYAILEKHLQKLGEHLTDKEVLASSVSKLVSCKYSYKMNW